MDNDYDKNLLNTYKTNIRYMKLKAIVDIFLGPDKIDENLPNYPGFEKDVFRVVKDYFCELPKPLMTYNMYEVITNVFGKYTHL